MNRTQKMFLREAHTTHTSLWVSYNILHKEKQIEYRKSGYSDTNLGETVAYLDTILRHLKTNIEMIERLLL